ncbi:MAG: hypothetical protein ACLTCB_09700, partial [Merdibacter sp.]
YLKENDEFEEDDHSESAEPDLEVYVHVTNSGFGLLGHVDIGFEGTIISYGNYDTESYRLNSVIGDGVFFLSPIESTIENYLSVEKNNLFVYGLRINEEQKAQIRQAINRIVAKGIRWHTKIERENGFDHPQDYQEDYPSRLVCKTGAQFYKFVDGRFKTYFALGSNCVLAIDHRLVGNRCPEHAGTDHPGTYLITSTEYHKKVAWSSPGFGTCNEEETGRADGARDDRREKRTEKVWCHEKDTTPFYRQKKNRTCLFF